MSRIGKLPVTLPKGVTCTCSEDMKVSIKGPNGELHQKLKPNFKIKIINGTIEVACPSDEKSDRALHGLYRALIANMVIGVNHGYKEVLELVGVGYKALAQGNILELNLGFSHNIFMAIPAELKLQAIQEKGKNPMVILEGIDKQLVSQVAAKIKSLRKVEPYKGKGIRYFNEYVRRKAGKAAAK